MDTLTFVPSFSFALGAAWGYATSINTLFIPAAATTAKYIDVTGRVQQFDFAVSLAHEMYHAAFEFHDPVDPQFSSPNFDYHGKQVLFENTVANGQTVIAYRGIERAGMSAAVKAATSGRAASSEGEASSHTEEIAGINWASPTRLVRAGAQTGNCQHVLQTVPPLCDVELSGATTDECAT